MYKDALLDLDDAKQSANSPGGIAVESLSNIRTVASLTLEEERVHAYSRALARESPHGLRTSLLKGSSCTERLDNKG
jgi:hypothetical protein